MKNKGFTVVELMTTFILISIIATLLIKLVITMKEVYITGDLKTALLTKQGTMTDKIMSDLNENSIISLNSCGDLCITFEYDNGSKDLKIDKTKNTISYGNYTMKLVKGSSFGDISASYDADSIIQIKVDIKNTLLKENYGINIVYPTSEQINFNSEIVDKFK